MTISVLTSGVAGYYPKRATPCQEQMQDDETYMDRLQGLAGAGGLAEGKHKWSCFPPVPKVCPGKGLAPTPCHFAFSLLSPKQNQCLKGKETNQHIKYEFLKKMPLSVDSTQLAEPASSVPQAFGQPSFGLLPEKQWKCVSTLAFTEEWWVCGLGKHQQLLRLAQRGCTASNQCSQCPPLPHTLPLLCCPLHSALHPHTCGWRRVTGTLFSTGQCFSHSYQSLPVFLLIWHCKCILIMAPIQISFLLHIDEFHLLGSSTNPGRETTDVQWAQGPGSWVLDSLHCINTTLAFPPFMNVYMLCRSQISPPVHVFNHQVKLSAVQL